MKFDLEKNKYDFVYFGYSILIYFKISLFLLMKDFRCIIITLCNTFEIHVEI